MGRWVYRFDFQKLLSGLKARGFPIENIDGVGESKRILCTRQLTPAEKAMLSRCLLGEFNILITPSTLPSGFDLIELIKEEYED